jgi:hypothetical protein
LMRTAAPIGASCHATDDLLTTVPTDDRTEIPA